MKVLVANRGEIACRIIRALREMDLPSVAVFTEPDADAPHVSLADEAVPIGPTEAYLDVARIIQACRTTGAMMLHPGYGFLSQSPALARACHDAGVTFIGPSPEAMILLGDKEASRRTAEANHVPVLPGVPEVASVDAAKAAADRIGYPVLLKAAGGGGGRGMRLVESGAQMAAAFESAKREALAAFADGRIIVEKCLRPARHVEVQVLGDGRHAVALGERECSLQRRYQKIVEEAPAAVSEATRKALHDSAVKLVRAAQYANAATVEFLVGEDGSHYFLEVNTRIQVEHPVTEMLTGLDIVRAQVEIARGGTLPPAPRPRGHVIEARLNAEDPYRDFLPQSGRIVALEWPQRPGVRVDAGVAEGFEVRPFYDPLLAKIIAYGSDRGESRRRLVAALREMTLLGVVTNQAFLIQLLESDFFATRETFTTTVESRFWLEPPMPEAVEKAARSALAKPATAGGGDGPADRWSPWNVPGPRP